MSDWRVPLDKAALYCRFSLVSSGYYRCQLEARGSAAPICSIGGEGCVFESVKEPLMATRVGREWPTTIHVDAERVSDDTVRDVIKEQAEVGARRWGLDKSVEQVADKLTFSIETPTGRARVTDLERRIEILEARLSEISPAVWHRILALEESAKTQHDWLGAQAKRITALEIYAKSQHETLSDHSERLVEAGEVQTTINAHIGQVERRMDGLECRLDLYVKDHAP